MVIWKGIRSAFLAGVLVLTGPGGVGAVGADDKKTAAVDEVFADLVKPGSPGCALGVYRDGQIVYARGFGMANLELGVANSPQTVFDIGSTSIERRTSL